MNCFGDACPSEMSFSRCSHLAVISGEASISVPIASIRIFAFEFAYTRFFFISMYLRSFSMVMIPALVASVPRPSVFIRTFSSSLSSICLPADFISVISWPSVYLLGGWVLLSFTSAFNTVPWSPACNKGRIGSFSFSCCGITFLQPSSSCTFPLDRNNALPSTRVFIVVYSDTAFP